MIAILLAPVTLPQISCQIWLYFSAFCTNPMHIKGINMWISKHLQQFSCFFTFSGKIPAVPIISAMTIYNCQMYILYILLNIIFLTSFLLVPAVVLNLDFACEHNIFALAHTNTEQLSCRSELMRQKSASQISLLVQFMCVKSFKLLIKNFATEEG